MAGAHQNIFIILGHGEETPLTFEERPEVPADTTLVTITQSGNPTYMTEVCPFLEFFSNPGNEAVVNNPLANKEALEENIQKSIHIYTPTRKMPHLTITPTAVWNLNGRRGNVIYQFVRSGVYPFPLPPSLGFPEFEHSISEETRAQNALRLRMAEKNRVLCGDHIVVTEVIPGTPTPLTLDFYKQIYAGSVFPTQAQLTEKYSKGLPTNPDKIGYDFKITVPELMAQLGPGIYYYLICRADRAVTEGLLGVRMGNLFKLKGLSSELDTPLTPKEKILVNRFVKYMEDEEIRIFIIKDVVKRLTEYLKIARVFPQMLENLIKKITNEEYLANLNDFFDFGGSFELLYITEIEEALNRLGRVRADSNLQQNLLGGGKKVGRTRRAKRKSHFNSRNVRSRSYRSANHS